MSTDPGASTGVPAATFPRRKHSRAGAMFAAALALALVAALAFRLVGLEVRPMHHDEANQAVKFGALLEDGDYRYDPEDHHGPSLYYLTLPFAWLRGQATLASLDERTVRLVPVAFGAGLILLLPLLWRGIGRTAVAAAAVLFAVSPAFTYYSRFYIQETVLVFFAVGFLAALGRYVDAWRAAAAGEKRGGRLGPRGWAVVAGLFAGLAYATKETSVIVLGAGVLACVLAWWLQRRRAAPAAPAAGQQRWRGTAIVPARGGDVLAAAAAGLAVAFVFYSSFFAHPRGLLESFLAFGTYVERGVDPAGHAHPFLYYFGLLAWSKSGGVVWTEGAILLLAAAGLALAAGRPAAGFWPVYLGLYSVVSAFVFSALSYKTPWNLLPFYAGWVLMAGIGVSALWGVARWRWARVLLAVVLAAAAWHLGVQNVRASLRYPADPRNPYVYAHTTTDFLRLVERVNDLGAVHEDGRAMLVQVVAGPYEQWPLPWYLRGMTRVGYWTDAAAVKLLPGAPVIVASQEHAAAVEAAVGDRYVSEFFGLRPDVLLTVFIERPLWEEFVASRSR